MQKYYDNFALIRKSFYASNSRIEFYIKIKQQKQKIYTIFATIYKKYLSNLRFLAYYICFLYIFL